MWTRVRKFGLTGHIRTRRNITAANGGFSSGHATRRATALLAEEKAAVYASRQRKVNGSTARLLHQSRRTPLHYGNRPGTNCSRKPKRPAGDSYDKDSYNRAVRRAVDKANEGQRKAAQGAGIDATTVALVPRWHANQLRHTTATKLRSRFGLEAARTVLGHADPKITLTYAEADFAKAAEAMKQVG